MTNNPNETPLTVAECDCPLPEGSAFRCQDIRQQQKAHHPSRCYCQCHTRTQPPAVSDAQLTSLADKVNREVERMEKSQRVDPDVFDIELGGSCGDEDASTFAMLQPPAVPLPKWEVNKVSNGWVVGRYQGTHFQKAAKFYDRDSLDRFLKAPECPTCYYTATDLSAAVPLDARERLAAMFRELYNCHTASKCAAGEIGDREEFLRLKGMAEAYQDAESRVRVLTTTPATSEAQTCHCIVYAQHGVEHPRGHKASGCAFAEPMPSAILATERRRVSRAIESLRRNAPEPFPSDYNNAIDDALLAVDDNGQLEAPDTTPTSERERCARIAEHAKIGDGYTGHYVNGFLMARNQIAAAIRGQKDDTE